MDLGPVDRITTDAIGEPGLRTFYIQARSGPELVTIVVEKQQVDLLAASILELMANLDLETGTGPAEEELDLEQPFEPRWRAGKLSIGYDEGRDLFVLEAEEFRPEPEDVEEAENDARSLVEGEPDSVRMWATREQMFALSRHGAAVSERGRPTCQFCGNPMDPEGHACPAMNGHSRRD
ncbi:MAG: DUF3090 family protein [Actinomycetota bacterium]|nr:DUF3090 family protein [Actinomycetota bacterium]